MNSTNETKGAFGDDLLAVVLLVLEDLEAAFRLVERQSVGDDPGWIDLSALDALLQRRHVALQLPAVRAAIPGLVSRLLTDASDERVPPADWAPAELADRVAAIRRVVGDADAGELGYVASRLTGRVRLLTGMVRANRPGRALLSLSKLLVGAFGTAAFALTTETIWQMGHVLGGLRLAVIMLLGLTALVAWLIVAHDLWKKPDRETSAELARMFSLGTILTLTLATAVSYLVLFAGTALSAALLIDTSVLEQTLQRLDRPASGGSEAA